MRRATLTRVHPRAQCAFPWLMSNCWVRETNLPLGDGSRTVMLDHAGVKVGLIGLCEREWLASLSTIDEEELRWEDFVDVGKELAAELRARGAGRTEDRSPCAEPPFERCRGQRS